MSYVVNTRKQQQEMLADIGYRDFNELALQIPDEVKLNRELALPLGKSELEVMRIMENYAAQNTVFSTVLRGAGSYDHFIPSVVKTLASREEYLTAYTPYQSEFSQGILQSIFEYQSAICALTGMDVSNASVYDGASAAAEAVNMCTDRRRKEALLFSNLHPQVIQTIETYYQNLDIVIRVIDIPEGKVNTEILKAALNEQTACVMIGYPNFYGLIEDIETLEMLIHENGSKLILYTNPIALGLLKSPRVLKADIVVGEGQPLGLNMAMGGPYLGYLATTHALVRKMPGRIVGETRDLTGERAYALTLQAREQHIRREKASSSICSNQAHCALTAAIFLSALGPEGIKEMAELCASKAHYLQQQLKTIGLTTPYQGEFFHEFVTASAVPAQQLLAALEKHNILGGYPLSEYELLWCVCEKTDKATLDLTVAIVKEAIHG